MIVFALALAFI